MIIITPLKSALSQRPMNGVEKTCIVNLSTSKWAKLYRTVQAPDDTTVKPPTRIKDARGRDARRTVANPCFSFAPRLRCGYSRALRGPLVGRLLGRPPAAARPRAREAAAHGARAAPRHAALAAALVAAPPLLVLHATLRGGAPQLTRGEAHLAPPRPPGRRALEHLALGVRRAVPAAAPACHLHSHPHRPRCGQRRRRRSGRGGGRPGGRARLENAPTHDG